MLSLAVLLTSACTSVDIGSPKASRDDDKAGILVTDTGRKFRVLPDDFNYTGSGTYTRPNGVEQQGTFAAGILEGVGSERQADGTSYTGQWLAGERHGHGELVYANGDRYVGDFVNGLQEGKGTATTAGGVYRGTWQQGKYHGSGQLNAANGDLYQGQWQDGLRQGSGRALYADGGSYEGAWLNDLPNGFGRMVDTAGVEFEGSWINGSRDGYGVAMEPSGISYEGTWSENKKNGYGRESRPDGSYYAGEWRDNSRHGKGMEVYLDGSQHEGVWQDDRIAGQGTRRSANGISISGLWQGDEVSAGTLRLPGGREYRGPLFNQRGSGIDRKLLAWLDAAAAAGDASAQYFLGHAYLDYEDPAPDARTARVWLKRAAESGQADAQFRLSQMLLEEDVNAALRLLEASADQSHIQAHATLAEYHHLGRYVPRDYVAAIGHYEQAVARGSIAATNNLAWLLATTEDEQYSDPERAIMLIRPLVLYLGNWQHVDTLAAAHARLGETELAARLQSEALKMAEAYAGDLEIAQMQARLDLYRAALPYIEAMQ